MPFISNDVAHAARRLRAGGLVAFATETVYGLGADAANSDAVAELYFCKKRPPTHPVIVHLADFADAKAWAAAIPPDACELARRFCPGPLTLLLPRADGVLPPLCGGGDFIALRVPAHPVARKLLRKFGGGIAAPSANRFGRISPTAPAHVAADFADLPELFILDGGICDIGIESTIVGFSQDGSPFIARPGDIGNAVIAETLRKPLAPMPTAVPAPGNLPRHYAPTTPLRLLPSSKIALITTDAVAVLSQHKPAGVKNKYWRKAESEPRLYAHCLYRNLRELDALKASFIAVEMPQDGRGDWSAVMDRLQRAAVGEA